MGKFNCYARIYLPLTASGTPSTGHIGWYDLQIDGSNDAGLEFDNQTNIQNTVFEFRNISGNGYVRIFNETKTSIIHSGHFVLCKYKFTASRDATLSFINKMKEMLTFSYKNENYSLYRVSSGSFQVYTKERYNSFGATAIWVNWLGSSSLKKIYDQNLDDDTGYLNYAAWEMFDQHYNSWSINELKR